MSYLRICPLCGGELGGPSSHSDWCGTCNAMHDEFNRVMPDAWRRVTHGQKLNLSQWREIMKIQKAVFEGQMSEEEGKRQTQILARNFERILGYGPEAEAQAQQRRPQPAAKPRNFFEMPSLLEW